MDVDAPAWTDNTWSREICSLHQPVCSVKTAAFATEINQLASVRKDIIIIIIIVVVVIVAKVRIIISARLRSRRLLFSIIKRQKTQHGSRWPLPT